ncbi:MAG: TonB-dependent receptor [Pseudomonadota bacterium]
MVRSVKSTAFAFAVAVATLLGDQARAQDPHTFEFSIPAQPLKQALIEFGAVTRMQVAIDAALLRDRVSPGVAGVLTAEAALRQLIRGTEMQLVEVNGTGFALRSDAATPSSAVPEIAQPLEELTVYGTKQNLSLQDTQTSVALYTAESFDRQVAFDLDDLVNRTPNVSSSGSPFDLTIRGVGRRGATNSGGVTSNVYADGAPLVNRSIGGLDSLWDIDQVEILRGPQSTTQGRNALSGALLIRSKDPTYEWEVAGRIRGAELGQRQYSIMVNAPLLDEQLALRVALDRQEYEGDIRFQSTGTLSSETTGDTLRAKLLIEPDALPKLRLDLQAEFVDTEQKSSQSLGTQVPVTDPAFQAFDPFGGVNLLDPGLTDTESKRYILDAGYELSERWRLVALATHEASESRDIAGSSLFPDAFVTDRNTVIDNDASSLELRANFASDRVRGWIGGYFYDEDSVGSGFFKFPLAAIGIPADPPDSLANLAVDFATFTENRALFGEVTFDLSDRWAFSLGLRYDRETIEDTGVRTTPTITPPTCTVPAFGGAPCAFLFPPSDEPLRETTFDAYLPRGAAVYTIDDDQSVSFSIARGYRAGRSFLFIRPDGPRLGEVGPEYITNYEIAYRSQWLDRRLTLNANVFYTDWEDQQVSLPTVTAGFASAELVNAGESELYGLELDLNAELTDEWSVFASLGLLSTEYTSFPFAVDADGNPVNAGDPSLADFAGNEFPFAPSYQFSMGFSYENARGFFAAANVNLTPEQFSEVANLELNKSDEVTLANLRFGYRSDRFTVAAYVTNVFDEEAIQSRSLLNADAASGTALPIGTPSFRLLRPRLAGIQVDVAF